MASRFGTLKAFLLAATILGAALPARADVDDGIADNDGQKPLPSGQYITPTAATGAVFQNLNPGLTDHPDFRAGQAIKTAVSPDGRTLLIMTSGYNTLNQSPQQFQPGALDPYGVFEYIFVFDISGARQKAPKQLQVIPLANTFAGLVWAPDSSKFYVSGGADDDVLTFNAGYYGYQPGAKIALGHHGVGIGALQAPSASGLGLSADGSVLVAANIYNDSISVIDPAAGTVKFEYDLRPYNTTPATGQGVAGGETPFGVAVAGTSIAYVSSIRDREIVVVNIGGNAPSLVTRIALPGAPNSMILNRAQTRLYVTQDNSDQVAVIDTATNQVIEEIDAIAPPGYVNNGSSRYTGAAPNSLALSPDELTLYVTNGGQNSVAIIPLTGALPHHVKALIPTAWYPNSLSLSADGRTMYVVNGKSDPGANPLNLLGDTALLNITQYPGGNAAAAAASNAANQYILELEQAGFLTVPIAAQTDLNNLTLQVAANNGYFRVQSLHDRAVMAVLRARIKHIIYIVKENRTYDQVLGDLGNGANGDPSLTIFGRAITPNFHRIATNFVTLDNFFDSGEVSGNGWPWSTQGRETDFVTKTIPLDYASVSRAAPYDAEGQNRGIDTGVPNAAGRQAYDPRYNAFTAPLPGGTSNVLPGTNNDGAADGPNGARQTGYIWDSALRAGLTVRNYGFLEDLNRYNSNVQPPLLESPATANPPVQVGFPVNPTLIPLTDIYFRGFDNSFPDVYREEEWKREFDQYVANGNLPNLTLLRLMHDHFGNFGTAIGGINTPEIQQADNDLAVGKVADALAHSPYASNTLIFVIEDDAQDGPDHVDAHRSTAYVIGPYVAQHKVVSTRYSTVNMLRTMEDILGIDHVNLNTAYQAPMTDIFDLSKGSWTYTAVASTILKGTVAVAANASATEFAEGPAVVPQHDAAYWAEKTKGFDWSAEDRVPADLFNHVIWDGLMAGRPYPTARSGEDLRTHQASALQTHTAPN
jgi:YVTN family beta-propeller protein